MNEVGDNKSGSTKGLVTATWVIAIASVIGIVFSSWFMSEQVEELRVSTKLDWRPYPELGKMVDQGLTFSYRIGKPRPDQESDLRWIQNVAIGSDAYKARDRVIVNTIRSFTLLNKGVTPLWVKKRLVGALLESEWIGDLEKSPEKLVCFLKSLDAMEEFETDVFVESMQTYSFDSLFGVPRTMSCEDFEKIRDTKDTTLIVYPYIYIEYADFQGEGYNMLLLDHAVVDVFVADTAAGWMSKTSGLEVYRWDIYCD